MTRRAAGLGLLLAAGWTGVALAQGPAPAPRLGAREYEGWRQYNTHCARCHGQDVLGNPVAANLLQTTAAGGPSAAPAAFAQAVTAGRPARGMPGFAGSLTAEQVEAIYAYVKGRADGKIKAGRPVKAG